MKHTFRISLALATLAALTFAGCSVTSHTETAKGVDFSQYKTFAWSGTPIEKKDKWNNDITDNNIKNAVAAELNKKGWKEADGNPDVLLDYTIAVQRSVKRESDPVYSYPFTQYMYGGHGRIYRIWSPSMLMGYRSYNIPFREGQLTINMIDARNNKLIWQGWAKGEISSPHVRSKDVNEEVKSIFKKFKFPDHS